MPTEDPFGERLLTVPLKRTLQDEEKRLIPRVPTTSTRSEDPWGENLVHQAFRATHGITQIIADVNREHVAIDLDYHSLDAPMVVICPDFPGSRTDDIVKALAEAGMSSAVINYRGFPKSTGTFGFSGATYDIDRSLDVLTRDVPFEKSKIALLGIGYGAFFATNFAKDYSYGNSMVGISPIVDLRTFMEQTDMKDFLEKGAKTVRGEVPQWQYEHQELLVFNNPTDQFAYVEPSLMVHMNNECTEELSTCTLIEHLGICNLLVVHGTVDTVVAPEQGQRMYDLSTCCKRLETIEGADHHYTGKREQMLTTVTNHLTKRFGLKSGE